MSIEFGTVNRYSSRGFGFVSRTFTRSSQEVFFHISKIKIKSPEIAQKIDKGENTKPIKFWYKAESTQRGEQAREIWLTSEDISQKYRDEMCDLTQKIEDLWRNIDSLKPSWLEDITIDLLGAERKNYLSLERVDLENQRREAEEKQRQEIQALRNQEITRISGIYGLSRIESDELNQLLADMRPLGFTRSKQLSNHIIKNKLGYNYPNIAGVVRMERGGEAWDFNGGFPPHIYEIICRELNLRNQGTDARATGFESYEQQRRRFR